MRSKTDRVSGDGRATYYRLTRTDRAVIIVQKGDGTSRRLYELSPRPSLDLRHHSSDFEWGFAGSGPAQTALAVLLDYTGDRAQALTWYERFAKDYIHIMPAGGGVITGGLLDCFFERVQPSPADAAQN